MEMENTNKMPMVLGIGERWGEYALVKDWNSCGVHLLIPRGRFVFYFNEWLNWDDAIKYYNFSGVELE